LWFESFKFDTKSSSVEPGIWVYGYDHGIKPNELSWKSLLKEGAKLIAELLQLIDQNGVCLEAGPSIVL
jgi:hypothetical protein